MCARITAALLAVSACGPGQSPSNEAGNGSPAADLVADRPAAVADGTHGIRVAFMRRDGQAGRPVSFVASGPSANIVPRETTTNVDGVATARVTSTAAGEVTVHATSTGIDRDVVLRFEPLLLADRLRFAAAPASAVAGEAFDVVVVAENRLGKPVPLPGPASLALAGVVAGSVRAVPGQTPGTFTATIGQPLLDAVLIATAGSLKIESAPFDVRATHGIADWQLVGPEGSGVGFLLGPPNAAGFLAAVTPGGVFISIDGAQTWTSTAGAPHTSFEDAAWCADGTIYLAQAFAGIIASRDRGASFQRVDDVQARTRLVCDPSTNDLVVVRDTGLQRWNGSAFSSIPVPAPNTRSLAISADGTTWYASSFGRLFRSDDRGATWRSLPEIFDALESAVALDAAVVVAPTGRGILRSPDGGKSWSLVLAGPVSVLARGPRNDLHALLGDGRLFRSGDSGRTWALFGAGGLPRDQQWTGLVVSDAGTFVASNSGVYASSEGRPFRVANAGLGKLPGSLQADARTGWLYASVANGVHRSRDGSTWEWTLPGFSNGVGFDPTRAGVVLTFGPAGVMRSDDEGATWTALGGPPWLAPVVAPDGGTWYGIQDGLWRSDDSGRSWSHLWSWSIGNPMPVALAFEGRTLFFSSDGSGKVRAGLFRSEDGGATYSALSSVPASALLVLGSSLYVSWEASRSDDGGRTFVPLLPGETRLKSIVADPRQQAVLYAFSAGSSDSVPFVLHRTKDAGATWSTCLGGGERLDVFLLTIDPGDPEVLYVSTRSGIYRAANVCP